MAQFLKSWVDIKTIIFVICFVKGRTLSSTQWTKVHYSHGTIVTKKLEINFHQEGLKLYVITLTTKRSKTSVLRGCK